ncbi:MAG: DUF1622 domain-containing protein [Bdellovibrionales bacterium]|nr:DUF1622 domain-containing protein [Bdellovibrionales bacterium]
MKQHLETLTYYCAGALEVFGVMLIALAAILSTVSALNLLRKKVPSEELFERFRRELGRGILLGLEFLVAADIINTVAVEPTLRSVSVLGVVVVIRTFLSFSLEVEMQGRWPWQKHAPDHR